MYGVLLEQLEQTETVINQHESTQLVFYFKLLIMKLKKIP